MFFRSHYHHHPLISPSSTLFALVSLLVSTAFVIILVVRVFDAESTILTIRPRNIHLHSCLLRPDNHNSFHDPRFQHSLYYQSRSRVALCPGSCPRRNPYYQFSRGCVCVCLCVCAQNLTNFCPHAIRPKNFVRIAKFPYAAFGPLFAFHCP